MDKSKVYSWLPDLKMYRDRGVIRGVLTDETRLLTTFRIYIDKGLSSVPSWLLMSVGDILGGGVVLSTINKVQNSNAFKNDVAQIQGYHDAIRAEVYFHQGDANRVLEYGNKCFGSSSTGRSPYADPCSSNYGLGSIFKMASRTSISPCYRQS